MANPLEKVPAGKAAAAEYYATKFNLRVFPLYELSSPGVCSCSKGTGCAKNSGKHPRVSIPSGEDAVHPATTDVERIRKWWKKWPQANIGVWLEGSDLIVLDIDKNDKKDGFKGLEDIMAFEREVLPKTLTCLTPSGGRHHYFKFCEGVPNRANSLGPGLDTWHTKHYVILPPSNHLMGDYKWDLTQGTAPVDFPDWLKPKDTRTAAGDVKPTAVKAKGRPAKEHLDCEDVDEVERLVHALKHVDSTDRELWVLTAFAVARAFDWSDAGFTIYDSWAATAHNYDAKRTKDQYFVQSKTVPATPVTTNSIFEWARKDPAYKAYVVVDNRPYEIRERDSDQLGVLVDIAGIIHDFPIYQRDSRLVEIVPVNQDTPADGTWYPKGSFVLRNMTPDQFAMRMLPSKVKWLRKYVKGWKATAVSMPLSAAFLNIGNWPEAKKLRAFVQHPTIREDGSLLTTRGYDKPSGLFLTDEIAVNVKTKPTKADAIKALKVLMHPFNEFKWINGSVSKAAMLAGLFTIGIRHLFDEGVPLFAVDAPRQASGKTKLVRSMSLLWFGRAMATTPYASDPEEMKKHLASLLMAGDRIVLFDNVMPSTRVNDPTLNALLTNGRSTFRELGSQRMLDLDSTATFFMTGNSLKIVGDMIRRTIRMQIDPCGLHPMDRKFKIDPLEKYILEHRTELLSAALTCIVAFYAAGRPKPKGLKTIASFDAWSDVVRNMILWLDMDDVKECITESYETDDDSMEIDHLLKLLFNISPLYSDGLQTQELLAMAESNKPMKEAMLARLPERNQTGLSHPRVVNTILRSISNITIEGKQLRSVGPRWIVRDVDLTKGDSNGKSTAAAAEATA